MRAGKVSAIVTMIGGSGAVSGATPLRDATEGIGSSGRRPGLRRRERCSQADEHPLQKDKSMALILSKVENR